jgi:GlpG protein
MITSFANPRVAQAFVDYMATQGIILTIQQHDQSDVWLADESQAGRVQAELARFLENPADPRYLAASWQSGQTNSGLRYQRFPFFATLRHNAGPFTWAILLSASWSLSCKTSSAIGRSCCCWPGLMIRR